MNIIREIWEDSKGEFYDDWPLGEKVFHACTTAFCGALLAVMLAACVISPFVFGWIVYDSFIKPFI